MWCEWCHSKIYKDIPGRKMFKVSDIWNDEKPDKYFCSPKCLIYHSFFLVDRETMKKTAKEILDWIQSREMEDKKTDDLPF